MAFILSNGIVENRRRTSREVFKFSNILIPESIKLQIIETKRKNTDTYEYILQILNLAESASLEEVYFGILNLLARAISEQTQQNSISNSQI